MRQLAAGTLLLMLISASCGSDRKLSEGNERIAAANAFTSLYAHSRLSRWDVRAKAAGAGCDILFVQTSIVLEDSMVEALHYGGGAYDVYKGGIRQFCNDRDFRAAAYKDTSGRLWVFGDVTPTEASSLSTCR